MKLTRLHSRGTSRRRRHDLPRDDTPVHANDQRRTVSKPNGSIDRDASNRDSSESRSATQHLANTSAAVATLSRLQVAVNNSPRQIALLKHLSRLLGGESQGRVTVSSPGDRHEREAHRAAAEVMRVRTPEGAGRQAANSAIQETGQSHRSQGGLDPSTREFFESRFGHDFSNVRIHSDRAANESARALQARAYTIGDHVSFASNLYQPGTWQGRRLLAHELAHVVQQSDVSPSSRSHVLSTSLTRTRGDHLQRDFIATGDTAGFLAMVNNIITVQEEVRIAANGTVTIRPTTVQGPPTRDQTELLRALRMAIDDNATTTIEFVHGATSARPSDRNVIVGSYDLGRVDLDDVGQFGMATSHSRMGDNAAVQLVHEITEQYRKQVHGEAFGVAHQAGYAAQERLLGATLVNETPMTRIGGTLGEVTTTYRYPDGREVDVIARIDFATGQIVSVNRVVRP